jgi:pimeloyl-ACP methyl ester carboxylesterase
VESARFLSDTMPNAHLAIIPATGHFMFMERPELVAAYILPFLK